MGRKGTDSYTPDDIGELMEKELADIAAAKRQNNRGTDELSRERRRQHFEERMYDGGQIARRFEHVPPGEIETLRRIPTLRLWVLCAATLGYFPPSDKPWRRMDLMNDDPFLLDADGTRIHYSDKLAIEIAQRAALATQNLKDYGGTLPVQRKAEDGLSSADDYVKQSDFWLLAADMGWTVPEYARKLVEQSAPEAGHDPRQSAASEQEHNDADGIRAPQRENALTPIIQKVIQTLEAQGDAVTAATVYPRLRALADAGEHPFTTASERGLQWRNFKGKIEYLDCDALSKRLKRLGYPNTAKRRQALRRDAKHR